MVGALELFAFLLIGEQLAAESNVLADRAFAPGRDVADAAAQLSGTSRESHAGGIAGVCLRLGHPVAAAMTTDVSSVLASWMRTIVIAMMSSAKATMTM